MNPLYKIESCLMQQQAVRAVKATVSRAYITSPDGLTWRFTDTTFVNIISQIRHGVLTFSTSAVQYRTTRCLRQHTHTHTHTHTQFCYTVIFVYIITSKHF